MKILKYLLLALVLFLSVNAFSQKKKSFGSKKKEKKFAIKTLGAGIGGGEAWGLSFVGPAIYYGYRKPMIKINRQMNFSLEFHSGFVLGFANDYYFGKTIVGMGNIQTVFNFNALAGASVPGGKNSSGSFPVGAFIGPGLIIVATPERQVTATVTRSGDIGPMVNAGLRCKLGKSYFFEFRVYGGFSVLEEIAIGGANLNFPLNLKKANKRTYN